MCVVVSRSMKIATFLRKNCETPKRVVDFPLERDTFRNKIMEIVEDFDETSYNNNGKPWKSSRILLVNPNFFMFFLFFFIFSSFHFFIFSCSFMFFHSFIFFHFFIFCWVLKNFLGLNFVAISLDSSYLKNQFLGTSREEEEGGEGVPFPRK